MKKVKDMSVSVKKLKEMVDMIDVTGREYCFVSIRKSRFKNSRRGAQELVFDITSEREDRDDEIVIEGIKYEKI